MKVIQSFPATAPLELRLVIVTDPLTCQSAGQNGERIEGARAGKQPRQSLRRE